MISNNFIIASINKLIKESPNYNGGHFMLQKEWRYPSTFTKSIKELIYTLWFKVEKQTLIKEFSKIDSPRSEKDEDAMEELLSSDLLQYLILNIDLDEIK